MRVARARPAEAVAEPVLLAPLALLVVLAKAERAERSKLSRISAFSVPRALSKARRLGHAHFVAVTRRS